MRFWSLLAIWAAFFAACYAIWQWNESAEMRRRQLAAWQREQQIEDFEAALDKPVDLGERWLTLHELPALIEQATGLTVKVDAESLKQHDLAPGTPLRRIRGQFSARKALALHLTPLGLGFELRGGRVLITSAEYLVSESELQTVVYPLPQPDFAAAAVDHEAWHGLVTSIVQPESWDDVGGNGHCEPVPGGLVVVHTRSVHREVRQLIEVLGSLRSPTQSSAPVLISPAIPPAVWQRLRDALAETTSIAADDLPLDDLIESLAERHGIPMLVSSRQLEEAGVSHNTPITLQLPDVSLATALAWILGDLDLCYAIHDEAIVVTTPENCESPDWMLLAAHPVHDLVERVNDSGMFDYDSLIDVIVTNIAPESWVDVGGPGSIQELDGWLLVSQTYDVHSRMEAVLADLRRALSYKAHSPVLAPARSPRQRPLREALARPLAAKFFEEPLNQAMHKLGEQMQIPIVLSNRGLMEAGVNPERPITCEMPPRPLADQLRLMLDPLGLDLTVRDDVVLVSTPEDIESPDAMAVRVYDVRPLVDPDLGITDMDHLIDAITTLITPESWCDVGGPSSIGEFRGLLVFCQTDDGHEQVVRLLATLEAHCLRGPPRGNNPAWVVPISGTPADLAIEQALSQVVHADLCDQPLGVAVKQIAGRGGLPLVFDDRRLNEAGINLEGLVTLVARDISLESALRLVLDEHELILQVRHGALMVTTDEKTPDEFPLVAYRVDRLLGEGADALLETLTTVAEPQTWVDVGGPGALKVLGDWLLVSQSREVQRKIERLLMGLHKGGGELAPAGERQVREALRREVAMEFVETPLQEALAKLAEDADVPLVMSAKRLEEAGVNLDTPVNIEQPAGPLADQLQLLLAPLDLTFGVQHEVIYVATTEELERESRLAIRCYHSRSLPGMRALIDSEIALAEHTITTLIDSESWVDAGGEGAVRAFQGSLVVLHRDEIHERIERLFAALDTHCRQAAGKRGIQPLVVDVEGNPRHDAIERALARQTDVVLRGQTLGPALRTLAAKHGISLVADERVLAGAGCDRSQEIDFAARSLSLGGALDRLLAAWNLTYAVRSGALVVTQDDDPRNASVLRLYRVGDLLAPRSRSQESLEVLGELVIQGTSSAGGGGLDAWVEEGGASDLVPVGSEWLAVTGTLHQHHRVEDWLTERRTGQAPPRELERRVEAASGRWRAEHRSQQPAGEDPFAPHGGSSEVTR